MSISLAEIERRDSEDPLAGVRAAFHLPPGLIYLDGNSLGAAPLAALDAAGHTLREEWANDLITSWNKAGWFDLPQVLGAKIAPLIGAEPDETIVCDGTTLNLFKTLSAALALRCDRHIVVAEGGSFPTDLYILEGLTGQRSELEIRLEGRDADRLEDLIDSKTAVVLVNQVDYRNGALRDMAGLTRAAHAAGALIVWDLCHSAGVMPIDLDGCAADFAVGCGYKYLNGGPGAPSFVFAARRHHAEMTQPLTGWWGHARPFDFDPAYRGGAGMRRFLCGTQPILSMRALDAALDVFEGLDLQSVRDKSVALTDLFMSLVETRCAKHGLALAGPRDAKTRGSQVAYRHPQGYPIVQALIAHDVIGDFRAPDILRFGFAPLYLRYRDVWDAVDRLCTILDEELWRAPEFSKVSAVT